MGEFELYEDRGRGDKYGPWHSPLRLSSYGFARAGANIAAAVRESIQEDVHLPPPSRGRFRLRARPAPAAGP